MLLGGAAAPGALEGQELTSFVPPREQAGLRSFLAKAASGGSGSLGAAAALNVRMQCADGPVLVQLFHASMSGTGNPLHLLGLRQAPCEASAAGGAEEAAFWPAGQEAPAEPAGALEEICFDAGSPRLEILSCSAAFASEGPKDLLDWLTETAAEAFKEWVRVQALSVARDRYTSSSPSPVPLVLRMPASGQQELRAGSAWKVFHAEKAWLELPPLDDWQRGFTAVTLALLGTSSSQLGQQWPGQRPHDALQMQTHMQHSRIAEDDLGRTPADDGASATSMAESSRIIRPTDSVSVNGLHPRHPFHGMTIEHL
mmetsp:Transcript_119161/g.362522  ORF Transcript_119161/g.362522 Transcript_119161/m.362522 type:complete len:313 (-) Transcript_119161:90-1028(-)